MEEVLEKNEWIVIVEDSGKLDKQKNDSLYIIILLVFFILKYSLIYYIYSV